jgi:ribose 1,5-bisphosphate isomerase
MNYEAIKKGIKNLEIQGAENIAVAATDALSQVLAKTHDRKKIKKAYGELISLRSTEPALRNSLNYLLANYGKEKNCAAKVKKHFAKSQKRIAEFGEKKILNGMNVFTHCHSSTVENIIIEAHRQGKRFTVYNTETRPKYQGRKTAANIAKAGIKVIHMVDSAGRTALKKADIFLYGCDSLSSEGKTINKIGTEMLAEAANKAGIPVYCCTNTWKFNPQTIEGFEEVIEERDPKEVWPDTPKGVTIFNPAFEIVSPDIITGVITEIGIFKPESIVNRIAVVYPWLVETHPDSL